MPEAISRAAATPEWDSREIRVFLSSTFRDFLQERELLAKQVFPALRRKAQERGVELVEVDLRWGVTQAQAEDGHALAICLQQIRRCRPYFIGMLGDSYGSLTPSADQASPRAPRLEEELGSLAEQIGRMSYTDLEIAHGLQLLSDPDLEGRAFFYFRDPAYSEARARAGEPGWRSDAPEERQKLDQLKQRIRDSKYPLQEGLPDPQAIAAAIEADLWALIERLFPEGEQPDALEKEGRKHADYRRARSQPGQYIGGDGYIQQLDTWLAEGQQQILITGESGAGKSALIANWMQRHQQLHPGDVVYAHHLGCTNDASALRPLLGRLIDTASRQLQDAEVITEAIAVPEDWWELVARVAETLQTLGRWASQNGRRWIWVLDGLDRLAQDDQTALPWLPQNLPDGIHVMASALACDARQILLERSYTTLTIQELGSEEQEQLIQRYLKRYTKELDGGLRQQILNHKLAGSPLFLKVLLEELRQCGRFDTLQTQLDCYLSAATVDDLYERVLERLENDGHGDSVRQVMTALWASRAGLSEPELLAITDLAPLQWAPIDLALEKAFGRNGNRLVFDHDYLRSAVEDRYLGSCDEQQSCHLEMIRCIRSFDKRRSAERYIGLPEDYDLESDPDHRLPAWEYRFYSVFGGPYADESEIFWHLGKANQWDTLLSVFANGSALYSVLCHLGFLETARIWHSIPGTTVEELRNLVHSGIEISIASCNSPSNGPIKAAEICDQLADFLDHMGIDSQRLRSIVLDCLVKPGIDYFDSIILYNATYKLAVCHRSKGEWQQHLHLVIKALEISLRSNLPLSTSSFLLLCCELALATCSLSPEDGVKIIGQVEEMWLPINNLELATPDLLIGCELLAHAHESLGNYEKAFRMLCKVHHHAARMHGECSSQVRRILQDIVTLHHRSGDAENAFSASKNLLVNTFILPREATLELLDVATLFARLAISVGKHDEAREELENLFLRYASSFKQNPASAWPGVALSLSVCLSNIELIVEPGDIAESSNRYLFGGLSHYAWRSFSHIEEVRIGDLATKHNYQGDIYDSEVSRRRYLRWKIGIWTRILGVAHRETVNARLEMVKFYCYCKEFDDACRELVRILLQESDRLQLDSLSVFSSASSWCKEQLQLFASDPEICERLNACAHYLQDALDQIASGSILSPFKAHMELLSLQHRSQEHAFLDGYRLNADERRGLNWVTGMLSFLVAPILMTRESERERLSFRHGSVMGGAELEKLLEAYALWIEACGGATNQKAIDQNNSEGERLILAQVKRLLGSDHLTGPKVMVKFAKAYAKIGKTDIAEYYCSAMTSRYESILKAGGVSTLDDLSRLCMQISRLDQAEHILKHCLAGHEVNDSNPDDAIAVLNDVAGLKNLAANINGDKEILRRKLVFSRELEGHSSSAKLQCIRAFALYFLSIDKYSESFAALEDFFGLRRELYGPSDHETLEILSGTLHVLSVHGMQREALALSRDAQQALAVERGANDPEVLTQRFYQASLYEELGEAGHAEMCYSQCLSGRETVLGSDHPNTLDTVYNLAGVLSAQERRTEAIPLRRRELAWCREQNGDTDPGTLTSINGLGIDLRETGELEEAEALFRELVAGRQQVLKADDFDIGRALGGLAKTLEMAGKLDEALDYAQQALDHRLEHEGPDAWWTNRERLDLARVLHQLGRSTEALSLLDQLQQSMAKLDEPDDDDHQLLADAAALR